MYGRTEDAGGEIMTERIERTRAYLWDCLSHSSYFEKNPGQLDYRYQHSLRVAAIGAQIAAADGLDKEALTLGCLLHDISYQREFLTREDWKEHGREAARIARPWLQGLGLAPELTEEICYGIAIHVDGEADFDGEETKLACLIGDCDNIDRYDIYRIYETLESVGFSRMGWKEQTAWIEKRLPRMREYTTIELTTPAATALWQEKARYQLAFFERLFGQLLSTQELL